MKLNFFSSLALYVGTISSDQATLELNKPLHIGVSMGLGSRSHVKYLLEISELLIQKGHRISYLSADEFKSFGKDYNVAHYSLGDESLTQIKLDVKKPFTSKDSLSESMQEMVPPMLKFYNITFPIYEKFYKEDRPDLMICDLLASSCIESVAKNAIPMIMGYQSLMFSTPVPYLTMNGVFEPTTIEKYSFLQRMKHGIIDPIKMIKAHFPVMQSMVPLREYYGIPDKYSFPAYGHLGLGIANSFIGFDNPRKVSSHMNVIGPILSDSVPKLPEDFEIFLNNHSKVLYVAFGSMVRFLPDLTENLLQHFQRALNEGILDGVIWGGLSDTNFDNFPKTFTVNSEEYPTKSILDNTHHHIKLAKWAPQESILNHPNTKLFLSHGGLDSIYESLAAGTPMLILPFFGDQPRNSMLITEKGVGDYIEWPTMGDEVIYQKFVKLLDPNNLELQSKVRQMQLITKFSSKRKEMAADLIETYALSAKACRMYETPKPFEVPCEMKPYLPLDYKMSYIKANLIDVHLVAILILCVVSFSFIYFAFNLISKLSKKLIKQKFE